VFCSCDAEESCAVIHLVETVHGSLGFRCLFAIQYLSTCNPTPLDAPRPPHTHSTHACRPTFKQILSSIEAFQAQLAEGAELQYTPPHLPNIPPDPNTAAAGGRAATMPAPTPAAGQLAAALPPLPHKRRVQVPLLLPEPPAAAGNAAQQQQGLAGVDVGQRAGTAAVAKGAHQGVVGSPTAGGATGPTAASAPAAAAGLGGMHTPATSSIGDSSPGPSRRTSLSWSEVSHGRLG
jgi:hypothetical protein